MRRLLPLLLALPLVARAQDGAPASASTPPPAWSLGAGMSFGGYALARGFSPYAYSNQYEYAPTLPSAGASLERRVGERSWLALGIAGAADSSREDVPAGDYGVSRGESRRIAVSCGLRRALTAPGAPVELSLLAGATVGHLWTNYTVVNPAQTTTARTEGWSLGADAGLAVDRELSPGLSLRVATPLARVAWTESRRKPTAAAGGSASQLTFGVELSPRLELRLAF